MKHHLEIKLAEKLAQEDLQHMIDVINDVDEAYVKASIDKADDSVIHLEAHEHLTLTQALHIGYLMGGLHSCLAFGVDVTGAIGVK